MAGATSSKASIVTMSFLLSCDVYFVLLLLLVVFIKMDINRLLIRLNLM